MSPSTETNTHVLLIGIDKYLSHNIKIDQGDRQGTLSYPDLRGCVNDVTRMKGFLKRKLGLQDDQITKLTASRGDGDKPTEPQERWPTYENIVNAFNELTERAEPGDLVYIHYSGHGGRARTVFDELKGENGIDEALVPTDIGDTEDRYIRDLEFAKLLNEFVENDVDLRCTIDGCHTGGITRGATDVAVRSIDGIDITTRSTYSSVASNEELLEIWDRVTGSGKRNVKAGSGWLPEPHGYVLMAACRASEYAREASFEEGGRNGVFTHYLLELLEQATPGLSYKVLLDRLGPMVHSRFSDQTPQLQGEGDREVFGNARVKPYYAVSVQEIDEETQPVSMKVNVGQAHGITKDAQFAVYPPGTTDFSDVTKRQAIVKISELGAVDSRAEVVADLERGQIEQGAQAVLVGAGSLKLVKQVSVVTRAEDDVAPDIDQETPLRAIEEALEEQSREQGWVEPMTDPSKVAYQVALNETGDTYEIWDTSGTPIENLRPPISTEQVDAASRVVERLVHLARYHAIKNLRNNDSTSPLDGVLTVELVGKLDEFDPTDNDPDYEEIHESGNTASVNAGEWMFLRIRNNSPPESKKYLEVTLFDLQPDWGIQQIYPSGEGGTQNLFAPCEERIIPLQAYLPEGYEHGRDVLKVFATLEGTSFRWLELPSLDQPPKRNRATVDRAPSNPLEELFNAISVDEHPTRNFSIAAYPSKEWVTEQIEVETYRG